MIDYINNEINKRPNVRPKSVSLRQLKDTFGDCEKELRQLVRSGKLFYYEGANDIYFYTEKHQNYE